MNTATKALPLWGLEGAKIRLIAARENAVYQVDHPTGQFALRLHRKDYRTDDQLNAELDWMAWIAQSGLTVPTPKASVDGRFLQIIDRVQVDVLCWLSGDTLDAVLPRLGVAAQARIFNVLGRDMAKLHIASDTWPGAATCARPSWDTEGLLGETPHWDRFWENPELTAKQRELFCAFRTTAREQLNAAAPSCDFGLIHADLVPSNVMVDNACLHFIDFDDGGFGFRQFDVATALLKHSALPNFSALSTALIDGYHSQRPLDITQLDLFLTLRAMTYVGWNISRAAEDKTGLRNRRFIVQAENLAKSYLGR